MEAAAGEAPALVPSPGQGVVVPTPVPMDIMEESVTSIEDAIARVMKEALVEDGVKTGLNQVVKAIEGGKAHVVFLASNVNEAAIATAVRLLARAKNIPLVVVPDSKDLGRWAGLCKIDREGQARKIVGASCAAITIYGTSSAAFDYLQKHIQTAGKSQ